MELAIAQPLGCEAIPILDCRVHTVGPAIVLDRPHPCVCAALRLHGVLLWPFYAYAQLVYRVGFGHCHLLASHLPTAVRCRLFYCMSRLEYGPFVTPLRPHCFRGRPKSILLLSANPSECCSPRYFTPCILRFFARCDIPHVRDLRRPNSHT